MFNALRVFLQRWLGVAPSNINSPTKSIIGNPVLQADEAECYHPASDIQAAAEQGVNENTAAVPLTASGLVAYDENLLERARTQWQFGDWQGLANISRDTLQHHPDRAKLALLVAAAQLQLQQDDSARQFLRLAQDWGCSKKLITQILLAGVHNSLGRASAIVGQTTRALEHFTAAVALPTPGGISKLLTQARVTEQYTQLNLSAPRLHLNDNGQLTLAHISEPNSALAENPPTAPQWQVQQLALHDLGLAWAGNTVNTVIFRHHAVLTLDQHQFCAFYVDAQTLRIVQRDLQENTLSQHDIIGQYNLVDAHNSISLGFDRSGCLHISYDHHGSRLRYRRATTPYSISTWTDEIAMTEKNEEKVTYPTFILPHHGSALLMLYRDGKHNCGTARIKTYDEASRSWRDFVIALLDGAAQKPHTSNAYWNHPAIGSDGSLHLSFVWRMKALGSDEKINNANIGYAVSYDQGVNWQTSNHLPYQLPITQVNAETVLALAPGSNLMNQCSMALDSKNRPHIVFYANDEAGVVQYQHLWHNGQQWQRQSVSRRHSTFQLQGGGTLQIPISRPEIVIDRDDNVFVIFRGDLSDDKMAATCLPAPEYRFDAANTCVLFEQPLGFCEPLIDRSRWQRENVLTMLLQHNLQPNFDLGLQEKNSPIYLLDIAFTTL